GDFLVTPLHIFPDYRELLGTDFVGIRGGPIDAVLVRVKTDEGIEGIGSVGVGNGAAVYILEHHLKAIVLGPNPFNVHSILQKIFRSTINYGRKGGVVERIS